MLPLALLPVAVVVAAVGSPEYSVAAGEQLCVHLAGVCACGVDADARDQCVGLPLALYAPPVDVGGHASSLPLALLPLALIHHAVAMIEHAVAVVLAVERFAAVAVLSVADDGGVG